MTNADESSSARDDEHAESEDEDYQSPTDGYFVHRDHPRAVYVDAPGPASRNAKELDAAHEARSPQGYAYASSPRNGDEGDEGDEGTFTGLTTLSSPTTLVSSLTSPQPPDESFPLLRPSSLLADAPPPAYSAGHGTSQTIYHSLPLPQYRDLGARISPHFVEGEPESMGGPPMGTDVERNMYQKPAKPTGPSMYGRMLLIFLGFLAVACVLWAWALEFLVDTGHHEQHVGKEMPQLPTMPNWPSECSLGSYTESAFDFDSVPSFGLAEHIEAHDVFGTVRGRVSLSAALEGQSSPVHVKISTSISESYSIKSLNIQKSGHQISVMTPQITDNHSGREDAGRKPCLLVNANVFVKPGIELDTLDVRTTYLEIVLTDSFRASMEKTTLETTAAPISSENTWSSRETHVKTQSGSVSGQYNLLDLLDVSTQSGNINIDVDPKEASKEQNPAKLQCTSRSGSIAVHMPREDSRLADLPDRDFQTLIRADVGSITGDYIHGTRTELHSTSGSISANILPYSADGYESSLSTSSDTGTTHIDLKPPYRGGTIKRMRSSHTCKTGSLHLKYPQEWEGKIAGSTSTGSLVLRGRDVVVDTLDNGWVSKSVSAHKGHGDLEGRLTCSALTGAVEVTVGHVV